MRRPPFLVAPGVATLVVGAGIAMVASCGARTGLDIPFKDDASHPTARHDAGHDATLRHRDAAKDTGLDVIIPNDGRMLDVVDECTAPTYCVPTDPDYIYKCGERIYQCGSLQQCELRCADGGLVDAASDAGGCQAACVDPCLDTLGQNTSSGCEFYAVEMDMAAEAVGVCYAVFIVNQWNTGEPAKLEVDIGGELLPVQSFARIPSGTGRNIVYSAYNSDVGIPQNQVAILFLSRLPANQIDAFSPIDPSQLANCPAGITPAFPTDMALHGTGIGTAFHIRSNVPVVAYQMLPFGGGSARVTGATLLLPTNVWGTNYLAANAYHWPVTFVLDGGADATAAEDPAVARSGPSMVVVAESDDTQITINPVANINAGPGVAASPAGQPITYTIDQGQYVQFTQLLELSGSAIESNKPIAVIGASTIMDVPDNRGQRADHGEQMIPPVQALGSQYVGVRYRTRSPGVEEVVPWRIIGAVDGTTLTFDPPQNTSPCGSGDGGLLSACGAPTTVNAHQLIEFDAPGPFVVTSQDANHPFYMAQYMTGGSPFGDGGLGGEGDPEYVNVVSPAQYLPHYTFFTDPTYPQTNLVVIRMIDGPSQQFPGVTLDCAGTLQGWQPVGTGGLFQFTRIDLSTGDFQGQNGCNNGVHTIAGSFASDAGAASPFFGVTVWGWGSFATYPVSELNATSTGEIEMTESNPNYTLWVSYGYPAGANILKLNDVVLPAQ